MRLVENRAMHVRFVDGVEGVVRFGPFFYRGVFAHLTDPKRFAEARVEMGAVTWPGELDLAPDRMHDDIVNHGECLLGGPAIYNLDPLPVYEDDDEIVTVGARMPHVEHVEVAAPLTLFVRFDDGVSGTVRFEKSHLRGIFELLKDPDYFASVGIANGAVSWPNEVPDLSPDNMHIHLKRDGVWILN